MGEDATRATGTVVGGATAPAVVYGRPLQALWPLDPTIGHLNHGAFGAAPHAVLEEQARWRGIMEENPARFFMRVLPDELRRCAAEVAPFLGTRPERLAFVENATVGTGAVLHALAFEPGDEILTTDHVYNALRNTLRHVTERAGARLIEAPLPLPVTDEGAVVEAIERGLTPRTRLVVIDHVASASALTFPVRAIVALCRARGLPVLVDGAHAPGLLDLDVDGIGADWYVGNCHKWLCAPKGAAFIALADRPTPPIHPLAISHAYGQGFPAEFDKVGTRDPSAWLAVPAAIAFHARLGGADLRARNRSVARAVAARLAAETGLDRAGADDLCHAMVLLSLPEDVPATREEAARIQGLLYDRHRVEVAITALRGRLHLRLSVQAYNDESDFSGLGAALLATLEEPA